ncbi:MAG: cysteine synthase A [Armatimonadetes bacterium]|nr:cysteine synthase A [Armatimonadota bacterium]
MSKRADNILELIGDTPLVRYNRLPASGSAAVWGKHEGLNPGGSVKDRICLSMILDAEEQGLLRPGGTIIEPTSGNTGIGLAMVAAVKGYRCILTMPETMSVERRAILRAYGAEIVLTPGPEGMRGAIARAEELLAETPNSLMPQQFNNPANPRIHRETTAREILEALDGKVDAFVAGVGTGGTVSGVGEVLKALNPDILVVAVEPVKSPVLSGGDPGPHKIQGIGAGFVPGVYDSSIVDRVVQITEEAAFEAAKRSAREEGIFIGISAGGNVWAACEVAKELGEGKNVVTVLCDGGEKYISVDQFRTV